MKITRDYFAGFVEGEGFFSHSFYKTKAGKVFYPTFGIEQNDEQILLDIKQFLIEELGIDKIYVKKKGEKRIHYLRIGYWEGCRKIAKLLKKRMRSKTKQDQLDKWAKRFNLY